MRMPWEVDWSDPNSVRQVTQGAPRVQGPPRLPPAQTPNQARLDAAQAAAAEQALTRPPPPSGFRYRADGSLERIPGGPPVQEAEGTIAQRAQLQTRQANLEAATQQLLRMGDLYRQNYAGQGLGSAFENLPDFASPTNSQFNAAAAGLSESAFASLRVPGVGSQSDADLRQFLRANEPRAQAYDTTNEERLDTVQTRLNAQRTALGLPPVDWRNPPQPANQPPGQQQQGMAMPGGMAGPGAPGGPQQPPPGMDQSSRLIASNQGPTQSELSSTTRQEVDPVLRGVARRVGQMVAQGVPDEQIRDYIRRAGVDPAETNIDQALQYRRTPDFIAWRRANPRAPFPVGENFYTREVRQTPVRETISSIANSPFGAYAMNAGDAVTMGTLDNMTGNPAQARAGLDAIRQQYPGASLGGAITGGVLNAGALEAGLARAGLTGARAALAADAGYGAAYGAGSADEGNRLVGAGTGLLTGAGANVAGRGVARGAGRLATGARDATTDFLNSRNINLTLGAMAGRGGVLGRTVRSVENKLESIPILGDAIRARRGESFESFNRAGFDEALAPIGGSTNGQIGELGVEAARPLVRTAYTEALQGVVAPADDVLVRGLSKAIRRGENLPGEMGESFRYLIREHVAPALDNGQISGETYQALRQTLREERAALKGQLRANDYTGVIRGIESQLEALVRRQAPDAIPLLNRADAAYRQLKVVEGAVTAGRNTGGVFTPAQLGNASVANARRFGGNQATTERPFFELQRAGQEALPSNVPNSATADRAWIMAALPAAVGGAGAGTGIISPEQGALLGALGLPYTRTGQRMLQKMITERPEVVRRAGERLIGSQGAFGRVGVGAAVPLIAGPGY